MKLALLAITNVEGKILKKHLEECIKESPTGNNFETKVEEIVKILKR